MVKHEKLLKEENEIKEKLQNEVTKIKEKLEYFWSKSNNEIKKNEKINQGITKLKNEENNNNININKILSYISNINKNKKELNKLITEPMKSLKFNYLEEKSNINYEEFYFNGIAIPQNIEFKFKDISYQNLNLEWKVDNINNIYIDKNKIKYKVEARKNKEKFNRVYEGNN